MDFVDKKARKKTDKEYNVETVIRPILAELRIKKNASGYLALVDFIDYVGAYPEVSLKDALEVIKQQNYIGLSCDAKDEQRNLLSSMVRVIETALEDTNSAYLERVGMSADIIRTILDTDHCSKKILVSVLGDKYQEYSHEEIIIFFFTKKILKAIPSIIIEETWEHIKKEISSNELYSLISKDKDLMLLTPEEIRKEVRKKLGQLILK